MSYKIAIIIPISRTTYLDRLKESLESLEKPSHKLYIRVDGDTQLFDIVKATFPDAVVSCTNQQALTERDLFNRRVRISELHNWFRDNIEPCEFVFGLEDDSIPPKDTLTKMLKQEDFGAVYGVELGRHSVTYAGIWKVDDLDNPTQITSQTKQGDVFEVDAGGFYAFLTPYMLYKQHDFKPFEQNDRLSGAGPDIDYGIALRRKGYRNLVDWTIKVEHLTPENSIVADDSNVSVVALVKVGEVWRNIINPNSV